MLSRVRCFSSCCSSASASRTSVGSLRDQPPVPQLSGFSFISLVDGLGNDIGKSDGGGWFFGPMQRCSETCNLVGSTEFVLHSHAKDSSRSKFNWFLERKYGSSIFDLRISIDGPTCAVDLSIDREVDGIVCLRVVCVCCGDLHLLEGVGLVWLEQLRFRAR